MEKFAKIIAIDDDSLILSVVRHILKHHTVETAQTGEQGLTLFDKWQPDLVLLDYSMPGMDGLEVLKEIRRRDRFCPVLVLTATESIALAVSFMREGAIDYIVKPFEPGLLLKRVNWVLNTYVPNQMMDLQKILKKHQAEAFDEWSSLVTRRINSLLRVIQHSLDEIRSQEDVPQSKPLEDIQRATKELREFIVLFYSFGHETQ